MTFPIATLTSSRLFAPVQKKGEGRFKDVDVVTYADGKELARLHKRVMAPGEMEQLILRKADLIADGIPAEYRITIESK